MPSTDRVADGITTRIIRVSRHARIIFGFRVNDFLVVNLPTAISHENHRSGGASANYGGLVGRRSFGRGQAVLDVSIANVFPSRRRQFEYGSRIIFSASKTLLVTVFELHVMSSLRFPFIYIHVLYSSNSKCRETFET